MLFAAIAQLYNLGYRYNSTPSYPIGLYKVDKTDVKISRGKLILICPPDTKFFHKANANGYVAKGFCPSGFEPLIKKIAGIPGDDIFINKSVYINGIKQPKSRVYDRDPRGYKLKHPPKKAYHLKKNQLFLLSDYNKRSFDSRYFGPVTVDLIQGSIMLIQKW